MLVLTRRERQRVRIGTNIFVTVTQIRGGKVRLGIEAPLDTEVVREELEQKPIVRGRVIDTRPT